jgi:Na+/pantothenate symporter
VTVVALMIHAGGLWHVLDVTPRATVSTSGRGMKLFLSWIIYMGFGACVQPDRCFRMFAVRDENNMRKGVIISGAMVAFSAFSYLSIALAVRTFLPNIKNTDTTLATGLQVAVAWLIPWFVMNAWGSGMSNFTAGLLSSANIFIKDIFEPWYVRRNNIPLGPKRDRLVIFAARVFIVCIVLITVCVSFYPPVFIWTLMNLWAGSFVQFFPLFMLGFLWRGVTRLGAALGLSSGIICMVLWSFILKSPFGLVPGINSLAVNTAVLIIVSLLVPEKRELKEQREAMRKLASPEDATYATVSPSLVPGD